MTKPLIVFGTASFAEVCTFYFERETDYEVVGYTVTAEQLTNETFLDKPVHPFEDIAALCPPDTHDIFVSVGYAKLNKLREHFIKQAQGKGYTCASFVSQHAIIYPEKTTIGENVFIFEDNTVQPFTSIGDGTILWSGNHIGHHSIIGANCFITSHVVISGHCTVGDRCMIGVNATISDSVEIAEDNFIGPNALIQKRTKSGEAYIGERTKPFSKPSEFFFK